MATKPPATFIQPASFYTRVRSAWGVVTGEIPVAKPLGDDPIRGASPEEEGARPAEGTYTRAYGGFSIDPRWLQQLALNDDTILQREGQHDLKLYDAILDDPEAAAALQQRRLAVVNRPWEVDPGAEDSRAVAAADHLREQLKALPWDRICDRMLFGIWYGYAVGEAMYKVGPDGKYWLADILVPDRKWFAFTNAGELRIRTVESGEGEALPPNKFWAYRSGASHDFAPYGTGLAHWCYWPVWFKKNVIKFWAIYLEKFGMPTALGKFPDGATETVRDNLLAAAAAVGRDSAVIVPDSTALELMAQGRSSDGSYLQFVNQMDDYLRRVILGQTGTSKSEAQGLGGSQSEVMKDVRDEVIRSDSDLLHESFNGTIAKWLTEWNFGPDVAVPRVYRNLEDQEDLTALAERDAKLKALGWVRTEKSFRETYGEGYERAPEPEPIPGQGGLPAPGFARPQLSDQRDSSGNVVDLAEERAKRRAEFAAMEPERVYISRKLLPASGRALRRWAEEQGIPNLLPVDKLHTTVITTTNPVDWFELGEDWGDGELRIAAGGPRLLKRLGESGIVLQFSSGRLRWRHEELVERGAIDKWPEYLTHVTLSYDAADFDPEKVEMAFQGELVFGPEVFESVDDDWVERLATTTFAADDLDRIDRWAAELAREADPVLAEFAASLQPKLKGIQTADALRVVLLQALEGFPAERLGELAGLPMTAARAGAEAGLA